MNLNLNELRPPDRGDRFVRRLISRAEQIPTTQRVVLDDERYAYVVAAGQVDVFAVEIRDGQAVGPRTYLFRAETGLALFGLPYSEDRPGLLIANTPGTQLLKVQRSVLEQMAGDAENADAIVHMLDGWVDGLTSGMVRGLPPRLFKVAHDGKETVLADGEVARARAGSLWISQVEGTTRFCGRDDLTVLDSADPFPVSSHAWVQSHGVSIIHASSTRMVIERDQLWPGLERFHTLALHCIALNAQQQQIAEVGRLEKRAIAEQARTDTAFTQLASTLLGRQAMAIDAVDGQDPLLAACRMVGERLGITIHQPFYTLAGQGNRLKQIAQASRIRIRQVALRGQWWTSDGGPLLASVESDKRPVALIPVSVRRYNLFDPSFHTITPVTPDVAVTLSGFAFSFYRPFQGRRVGILEIARFGLKGLQLDLLTVAFMAVLAGLVGLLFPVLAGIVFDQVIPGGLRLQLVQIGIVLVGSAVAVALFQVTRNIAILRIESKMDASVQAAVFDRLLDLPTTFFRSYSAGDLGVRTLGIGDIRQILSRAAISALFAGVISTFNLILLFFYDSSLAFVALLLTVIFVAVTIAAALIQLRYERILADMEGKLSGTLLQFINGIAKFRVAGAERRAFAHWAGLFAQQRKVAYSRRTVSSAMAAFSATYSVITSMVIFSIIVSASNTRLSTGAFLAFYLAFSQFLAAALMLSSVVTSTLEVVPIFERAKPILHTLPEVTDEKTDPGELSGEIEINSVSFRYHADGPLILDEVSLHVLPGQFVALVGPSGSGKSTILRMLLGFETPDSGGVFYDGQDLTGLDIRSVRRQIGVVLQNGNVMSGDIFTNIIGASSLTLDDAWLAARRAGLDADIRQMPMGMQTVISEGGSTLSGGQRQRLLIARAIVNNPRIIFFDEATSAVDNRTQEIISKSLESLEATRVVIAHRLSTVINADKIFVVERGRIVQQGTYNELIKARGLFADLAKRQLV